MWLLRNWRSKRVEALEVVEKEREIVEQERAVYDSIADKISKSWVAIFSQSSPCLRACFSTNAVAYLRNLFPTTERA